MEYLPLNNKNNKVKELKIKLLLLNGLHQEQKLHKIKIQLQEEMAVVVCISTLMIKELKLEILGK